MARKVLQTRISDADKAAFIAVSKKLKYTTPSAHFRTLIIEAITQYPSLDRERYKTIRELRYQFRAVGNNLNQLTYSAHIETLPDSKDVMAALDETKAMIREALAAYGKLIKSARRRLDRGEP